jgi:micrococcal nuclease
MVQETYARNALVTRVVDGDTIEVDVDLGYHTWRHKETYRLARINCPEMKDPDPDKRSRAAQAAVFTKAAVRDVNVVVVSSKTDNWRRWLAEVWYMDGGVQKNLSDELLSAGLADPYKKG